MCRVNTDETTPKGATCIRDLGPRSDCVLLWAPGLQPGSNRGERRVTKLAAIHVDECRMFSLRIGPSTGWSCGRVSEWRLCPPGPGAKIGAVPICFGHGLSAR